MALSAKRREKLPPGAVIVAAMKFVRCTAQELINWQKAEGYGFPVVVNFEGESVAELTNAFHEAVDDYLAYCAEEGIEPHKSYSGSLNVRLIPTPV